MASLQKNVANKSPERDSEEVMSGRPPPLPEHHSSDQVQVVKYESKAEGSLDNELPEKKLEKMASLLGNYLSVRTNSLTQSEKLKSFKEKNKELKRQLRVERKMKRNQRKELNEKISCHRQAEQDHRSRIDEVEDEVRACKNQLDGLRQSLQTEREQAERYRRKIRTLEQDKKILTGKIDGIKFR